MKLLGAAVSAVIVMAAAGQASAQTGQPVAQRSQLAGTVAGVNAAANQISLKTDAGQTLDVTTTDRTLILHAQPGETDPKKWSKMAVSDIAAGDKMLVYFRGAADQNPLVATSLVVRTRADLAQLTQKDLEDWRKRGTSGIVTALDPAAKTITLKVGTRTVTVESTDKTVVRRYSPDSAKPAEAKASRLEEVKAGDQVNVLGDRSQDGTRVKAETVYFGTFRQIAATIVSVDAASGEMKVTDLATKKPLVIRVTPDSTMKKLPEQLAQMLARRYNNRGGAGEGQRGGGGPPEGTPAAAGRGGGMRGGDIGSMLDRLPAMPLSELKAKDAIMVSTTVGSDPTRVTAVMLLAGVEPLLTASPNSTRDIMSGWNLGGGAGAEGN